MGVVAFGCPEKCPGSGKLPVQATDQQGRRLMMMSRIALVATITLVGCSVSAKRNPQLDAELAEVRNAGVSFAFDTNDFSEVGIEKKEKQTAQDIGDGILIGVAPDHSCFNLKDKRPLPALELGARYFFPTYSFICAIPLQDSSVNDFGEAYPDLRDAESNLRRLLRERPHEVENRRDLPDIPYNNASPSIVSRFQYLDFRSGSGLLFLTQYSQEMEPNPVNNEELTLSFQGITKDGRYYVAARLAVTHPSLPRGIDFTDNIERDSLYRYLREGEQVLEQLTEESFNPSLNALKALLSSIYVE